jgi:hypothetical protein
LGPRSIANMVFIVLLAAALAGLLFFSWNMFQGVLQH